MAKLKLIASTLVESIVAMVIISITMGSAFLILSNITAKNSPELKFRACLEAQHAINEVLLDGSVNDEVIQKGSLLVEIHLLDYKDYEDLKVIHVKVLNHSGKTLVVRKELIKLP